MKPIDMNDDSAPGCAAGAVCANALLMKNMIGALSGSDVTRTLLGRTQTRLRGKRGARL
jgi:hypothetical protein